MKLELETSNLIKLLEIGLFYESKCHVDEIELVVTKENATICDNSGGSYGVFAEFNKTFFQKMKVKTAESVNLNANLHEILRLFQGTVTTLKTDDEEITLISHIEKYSEPLTEAPSLNAKMLKSLEWKKTKKGKKERAYVFWKKVETNDDTETLFEGLLSTEGFKDLPKSKAILIRSLEDGKSLEVASRKFGSFTRELEILDTVTKPTDFTVVVDREFLKMILFHLPEEVNFHITNETIILSAATKDYKLAFMLGLITEDLLDEDDEDDKDPDDEDVDLDEDDEDD